MGKREFLHTPVVAKSDEEIKAELEKYENAFK